MKIGDSVARKSHGKDLIFKIVGEKEVEGKIIYELSGLNIRILADSPEDDLEVVDEEMHGSIDQLFNKKVNETIKSIIMSRGDGPCTEPTDKERIKKKVKEVNKSPKDNELTFGRPGKILHVDGDPRYLNECMKVYKQLDLVAEGRVVAEKDQPNIIVQLVKETKAEIVVITGHDGIHKDVKDYQNINNYRNSKYFVESVARLRDYEPNYDNLVIFAGACQSYYEAILDAGANLASAPKRVLIHCLDPVFICEKIAYASIDKVVDIKTLLASTITGFEGIGGIQTRGKYREGFPRSFYK